MINNIILSIGTLSYFITENYFWVLISNFNICLGITLLIFLINSSKPFILILSLELFYLFINIQYVLNWLFLNNVPGITYVLIILCLSAAESIIGISIILKLYHTRNFVDVVSNLNFLKDKS